MKFEILLLGNCQAAKKEILSFLKEEGICARVFQGEKKLNQRRYDLILSENDVSQSLRNNFRQPIHSLKAETPFRQVLEDAVENFKSQREKQFLALKDMENNLVLIQEISILDIKRNEGFSLLRCREGEIKVKEGLLEIYRHLFEKKEFRYVPFREIQRIG